MRLSAYVQPESSSGGNMKKLFMLVFFLCSCVLCAEPDSVESIPFEISKWKERRTTIKNIGPITLWGNNTYSYKGDIKFDGKKYRANFTTAPRFCLKFKGQYYIICGDNDAVTVPLELYDYFTIKDNKLYQIYPVDIPFEVLAFRIPSDFRPKIDDDNSRWVGNYYYTALLNHLKRREIKRFQQLLKYYLENIKSKEDFPHNPSINTMLLLKVLKQCSIPNDVRKPLSEDVKKIISQTLNVKHSPSDMFYWIAMLLHIDYDSNISFVKSFAQKYVEYDDKKLLLFSDDTWDYDRQYRPSMRNVFKIDYNIDIK